VKSTSLATKNSGDLEFLFQNEDHSKLCGRAQENNLQNIDVTFP
jgi:hypothetical protein